ncbi:MAG TPA: amidohydrolase family protein, partial [Isosphaeraceae bacterium]|nr:amidohydrolase family protein [Isosphaeraceae bacterium]
HRLDRPVAAHAMGLEGIRAAIIAGVDSIEHGYGLDEQSIDWMVQNGIYWCPTIYVAVWVADGRPPIAKAMVDLERDAFALALKKGVKIAYGTDVGGYAWTENQAKELAYMVRYGMTPMQAIQSATVVASELLSAQDDLGSLEPGHYADLIAVKGDPLQDVEELQRVRFVMKGGVVFKNELMP